MYKIITLFILAPLFLFGQATKKITDKKTNEVYYVLKSDKTIRQGSYQKSGWNGKPLIEGDYRNGNKDSVWTFYDFDGAVAQKYNFTKKQLLFEKPDTAGQNKKWQVIKGAETVTTKLDKCPEYIGGSNLLSQFLADNVEYPESAKDYNEQGTVQISFIIDKNGNTSDFKVAKGVYPALDQESLRVVKMLPPEWMPGILNGKKVDVIYTLPVRFVLR